MNGFPVEVLREGDRIKVYVVEVRKIAKGPQIMISRTIGFGQRLVRARST
jgi:transcription antitermination factor NusA-like protein